MLRHVSNQERICFSRRKPSGLCEAGQPGFQAHHEQGNCAKHLYDSKPVSHTTAGHRTLPARYAKNGSPMVKAIGCGVNIPRKPTLGQDHLSGRQRTCSGR